MSTPNLSQNYFELLGLTPGFDLDINHLRGRQQQLQSQFHPDRHVTSDPQTRRFSVQMAAQINQAFETLRDPVKRAYYLLEIAGAEIPNDSTTTSDSQFLFEQIELREAIDACRQSETALQEAAEIGADLNARLIQLSNQFVTLYKDNQLDAAIDRSRKMQFIQRIQQQLAEVQYELEVKLENNLVDN